MKFINYLKENVFFIIFLILLYIILTIKFPYTVYAPGDAICLKERISAPLSSDICMTSVSSMDATIPGFVLGYLLPSWDIVKNEDEVLEGETIEDLKERSRLMLKESVSSAKYIAYEKAGEKLDIKKTTHNVAYILKEADTDIKVGDEILSYDGHSDVDNIYSYIESKNAQDKITFEVLHNGKKYQRYANLKMIEGKVKIGVVIFKIHEYENSLEYQAKDNESGSSGGLMLSIALYDALTLKVRDDIKICGTGAINLDGTVDEISGVKYKIKGAKKAGCDVFIVPKENYEEAKKENIYDIELIKVETFSEALTKLDELELKTK